MSYSILIVDDSRLIRTMMRRMLDMTDLVCSNVFEAGDGIEALEVLEREWIDLVFCDLNMPRMSGVELIDKLHEKGTLSYVPLVVVTSDQSTTREAALLEKGVKVYLKKPLSPECMSEAITALLGASGVQE